MQAVLSVAGKLVSYYVRLGACCRGATEVTMAAGQPVAGVPCSSDTGMSYHA